MPKSPRLDAYHRKRDATRTPEPMGGRPRRSRQRRFVIQKHQARRLHYDLRLEMHGVLKSWAVPKGPSVDPAVRRLAVQVEDHPLEYATFEGAIPRGSYGAGSVIVWDRGTYRLEGAKSPDRQLADGHLELTLSGEKLRGRWLLVRTRPNDPRQWLLVKRPDAYAGGSEPTRTRPESVCSDAVLPDTATGRDPALAVDRRLPRARLTPRDLPFMLPTLATTPPDGSDWIFEIKWDGIRLLILRQGGAVRLFTRSALDVTPRFPEVATAAAALAGGDLALDAEVVALDTRGRPSFHRLQRRTGTRGRGPVDTTVPVRAYAHDCLALDGRDLRRRPLSERNALLRALVGDAGALRYCDHVAGDGAVVLAHVRDLGLEGIVAKRRDAPYRGGRRREWLKIKCDRRQEFVIGGYTDPKRGRPHLGALHLGVYAGRRLTYAGRVGTGFDDATLAELAGVLRTIPRRRSPFVAGTPPKGAEHHWVRPLLVCEVRFSEWTPDGHLRHPVFLGMRPERRPATVRREQPAEA
jgi:bifunctional non-homologous end joining protein LigD